MFDYTGGMSGDTEITIATLRTAARAMQSVTTADTEAAKAIRIAIDALSAELAQTLAMIAETKGHERDGASSIGTWARRELHQDAGVTRQMVRAAATFKDLPQVGESARNGQISFEHAQSFTYALRHVGVEESRALEKPLLDIARHVAPSELHHKVRQVRDTLHADDLDDAWLKGMDKRDIRLARTSEGWHLTGFLDIETGAKLKTILKNHSVPRDSGDTRAPAQRRMDALDDLCTKTLEQGLPADNGIRPHIFVTVDADTLKSIANQAASKRLRLDHALALKPAHLEGFGAIGPQLLAHLMCGAEITPILVETVGPNPTVLDVGRTARYATPRQAKAIRLQRGGECAAAGCKHPIAHNHHLRWWSSGGSTDLDNMVGLCRKCHTLIHAGKLTLARGSPAAA